MASTPRRTLTLGLLLWACASSCGTPDESRLDVSYDDRFGAATTMDVYFPSLEIKRRPGVLFIHGGGLKFGSKRMYTSMAKRLARSGYVAATINYRLTPDGRYPRSIQDTLCALSHFRGHADAYGLDPARVAVMGYSGGAYLSTIVGVAGDLAAHQPDCAAGPTPPPRAVISGAPKTDLRGHTSNIEEYMGVPERDDPALWAQASPIDHVGPGKPPFLFIHGGGDWINDLDDSYRLRDALVSSGNDARVVQIAGGGHIINPGPSAGDLELLESAEHTPEAWLALVDFLDRTIGHP